MEKAISSWLNHLANDPERIDSLFMWLFCVIVVWLITWFFRNLFIKGLAGDGKRPGDTTPDNLDAREQILFIYYYMPTPIVFYVAFFHHVEAWNILAMWATLAPLYYQIFGRFIFDWIVVAWNAFKGNDGNKPVEVTDITLKTEEKK